MNRRHFLLSALAAPAIIRTPGLIMPVKPLFPPRWRFSGEHGYFAEPLSAHLQFTYNGQIVGTVERTGTTARYTSQGLTNN